MIGFFSLFKDGNANVKKDGIYFVSIPDGLDAEEIKDRFSQLAQTFANTVDSQKVYLIYGKEDFIEYDYSI